MTSIIITLVIVLAITGPLCFSLGMLCAWRMGHGLAPVVLPAFLPAKAQVESGDKEEREPMAWPVTKT